MVAPGYTQEGDVAWIEGKVRRLQAELDAFLADGGREVSGLGVGALRDLQVPRLQCVVLVCCMPMRVCLQHEACSLSTPLSSVLLSCVCLLDSSHSSPAYAVHTGSVSWCDNVMMVSPDCARCRSRADGVRDSIHRDHPRTR